MPIKGEYWITADGRILSADGDNGDDNHQTIACRHAISLVYGAADNDPVAAALLQAVGGNAATWEGDVIAFREALLAASDALARRPQYEELYDDYEICLSRAGVSEKAMAAMWDLDYDPRLWATEECGWIIVQRNNVFLRNLTDSKVRRLRDGLWDILMAENGKKPPATDEEFLVIDTAGDNFGTRYEVTWATLEDGLASSLHAVCRKLAAALPGR